jgi:DNA-binding Lrp family transcriptional regulator
MVTAFVMVVSEPGKEKELAEELRRLPQVKQLWEVYGEYDIVARLGVESLQILDSFVREKIRRMTSVRLTTTMISVE